MERQRIGVTLMIIGMISGSSASELTQTCRGCHGEHFERRALNASKIVRQMSAEEIERALHGYQKGTYGGSMKGIMFGQTKHLTDKTIRLIVEEIITDRKYTKLPENNDSKVITHSVIDIFH